MVKIQRLFAKTNLIIQVCIFLKKMYGIKKAQEVQMKSHKYWSIGALVSMIGTCYTGYKNMKSAYKYCGKVWYVCGMVMLPITVIFMLLVIGKNEDCVGSIGGIICGIQLIPLIGSILPTEIALKKNFDKNGTRR